MYELKFNEDGRLVKIAGVCKAKDFSSQIKKIEDELNDNRTNI